MSYYYAMGAIPAGSYPVGTRWAVGYYVTGLPADQAAAAVQRLRDTVAYGYRGRLVGAGWGPNSGIPSGHLYALLETGAQLDANTMNSIAANMAANLQTRLPGTTVRNTHAHIVSRPSASTPATTTTPGVPTFDPTSAMPGFQTPTPGYPSTIPGYDPYAYAEPSGLSMSVGGIPLWALLLGGTVVVGGIAYAMMQRPRRVAMNRRRRRRKPTKNRRRRTRRNTRNTRSVQWDEPGHYHWVVTASGERKRVKSKSPAEMRRMTGQRAYQEYLRSTRAHGPGTRSRQWMERNQTHYVVTTR